MAVTWNQELPASSTSRTVERNIKKGLITRKDYEKHLKTLEDVADKGVYGGPAEPRAAPSRPRPPAGANDQGHCAGRPGRMTGSLNPTGAVRNLRAWRAAIRKRGASR